MLLGEKNRVGGLCIMWNLDKIEVERIKFKTRRGISLVIIDKVNGYKCFLTNIYAPNNL